MSSNSHPVTLSDRAEALTIRNGGPNPAKPPAVAAASPIHEILVQEVAAALPPELRTQMEAEPSVERVMDWIGVGAVARWVRGDTIASRAFAQAVSGNPAAAGMALARALAARMEPPQRDATWHRADRVGLARQLLFAFGVLLLRVVLFAALGWVGGVSPFPSPEARLLSLSGLGLLLVNPSESLLGIVLYACAEVWLLGEALLVPPAMERIRREPARLKGLAPPLSWRLDTFPIFWRAQAVLLAGVVVWRLGAVAVSTDVTAVARLIASLACLPLVGFGLLSVRRWASGCGQP